MNVNHLIALCKPPACSNSTIHPNTIIIITNIECKHFFTLSHSLPLQESHLNTGLLIAEIQANLAWNKANKMVDKIQPYNAYSLFCFPLFSSSNIVLTFQPRASRDASLKQEISNKENI